MNTLPFVRKASLLRCLIRCHLFLKLPLPYIMYQVELDRYTFHVTQLPSSWHATITFHLVAC